MRTDFLKYLSLAICLILALLIITLHASAIPYALWQGDEYDYFYNLHTQGSAFFWNRLLFWSPRPLSEAAIALYGMAVAHWNRPLIGYFLGIVWSACAFLAFFPFLWGKEKLTEKLFFAALAVALIFLGHPIADLHYWPMATVAHLPVVAAATCLTLTVITERDTLAVEVTCLSIAALSSEAGLFFSGSFLALRGIALLLNREFNRTLLWLLIPIACCSFVVWQLLVGRIGLPHLHSTPTHGYAWASLRSAIRPLIQTLLMLQPNEASIGGSSRSPVLSGIVLKTLLMFASAFLCRAANWRPSLGRIATLMLALIGMSFLTIASAFYEFGFLCCQRHETVRLDVTSLMALLAGAALAPKLPHSNPTHHQRLFLYASLCLSLFVLETARWRYADMRLFFMTQSLEAKAREATWQSGKTPGPDMTVSQGANTSLFYYWKWEPGHYKAGGPGWEVQSMMKFFNKKELTVLPPVQIKPEHTKSKS